MCCCAGWARHRGDAWEDRLGAIDVYGNNGDQQQRRAKWLFLQDGTGGPWGSWVRCAGLSTQSATQCCRGGRRARTSTTSSESRPRHCPGADKQLSWLVARHAQLHAVRPQGWAPVGGCILILVTGLETQLCHVIGINKLWSYWAFCWGIDFALSISSTKLTLFFNVSKIALCRFYEMELLIL